MEITYGGRISAPSRLLYGVCGGENVCAAQGCSEVFDKGKQGFTTIVNRHFEVSHKNAFNRAKAFVEPLEDGNTQVQLEDVGVTSKDFFLGFFPSSPELSALTVPNLAAILKGAQASQPPAAKKARPAGSLIDAAEAVKYYAQFCATAALEGDPTLAQLLDLAQNHSCFSSFWKWVRGDASPCSVLICLATKKWCSTAASSAACERMGSVGRYISYGLDSSIGEDTLETKMLLSNNRADVAEFAKQRYISTINLQQVWDDAIAAAAEAQDDRS